MEKNDNAGSAGSIPAYAGDPDAPEMPPVHLRVYPRLRGGSSNYPPALDLNYGLSPPTRGILPGAGWFYPQRRSIPAYAGDPCRPAA